MGTTVCATVVEVSDGLRFLLDAPGMALIAIGFALYLRTTLPVAAAFRIFSRIHVIASLDRGAGLPPRVR